MPKVSGLGTIFAPDQANSVNAASDAIDDTLGPGSNYFQSGNIDLSTQGTLANGLLSQAAALTQPQVSVDTSGMDRDSAALQGLANQYYGLAQNGGMAEAAAQQQAVADMANLGVGGSSTGKAITQGSRELMDQASGVANAERSGNAQGATSASAASAATELQKLVYAAHVSHANHATALAARGYQSALTQMQGEYNQALSAGAAGARNQQASSYQSASNTTRQGLLSAAQTIASAGGTAAATVSAMGTQPAQTYTKDVSGRSGGISFGVPNGAGGMTGPTASVTMQPMASKMATFNPYLPEAEGNTTTAPDPKQWSTWLSGSSLAP